LNEISEVANRMSEVKEFLKPFVAMESVSRVEVGEDGQEVIVGDEKKQLAYVDEKGRTVARGKRKEAKARVQLIKVSAPLEETRSGKTCNPAPQFNPIIVNRKPLSTYFMRMRDRVEVCKPFEVTSTFGKYRLNCSVEGGGHTGMHTMTTTFIHLINSRVDRPGGCY
jgi:ribosomal protein S9